MNTLAQKVIVVIGGTAGLGLSACQAFLQAGAQVVAVGRDARRADQAQSVLGSSALALAADATDPDTARRAIATAQRHFGGFSALYHVAGGSGRAQGDGPLHTISDEGWSHTLQLNLSSVFYSNRAAISAFLKQHTPGVLLNMSSVLGFAPSPHFFATHAYAAAKSAIIGLTRSAASYYAPHNIRCNVLAPALVQTRMSERASKDQDILKFIRTKQPLDGGRIGQPEDLDAAAVYLLSEEARFVTGQVLVVDGGWTVSEGQLPQKPKRRPSRPLAKAKPKER